MRTRIAINGFGRIGRLVLRAIREQQELECVGINDITDAKTLAHLLKWDSIHGPYQGEVQADEQALVVDGVRIPVLSERDPGKLPWDSLGVAVAIEATGLFAHRAGASQHLEAGAERVLITAPAKDPDLTVVLGVNGDAYRPDQHRIVSNASCTTNCLAPVAKVLHTHFGIEAGWMTTIHAITNDQRILDLPHSDLRRARAANLSMIPTSTGAARAIGLVLPELVGKLDGYAMRVPTADVSVVDLAVQLAAETTPETIVGTLREAAAGELRGILEICDEPLVSADFLGNPHSSIVDTAYTKVMQGRFAKLVCWYDNEWGYANRVAELARHMAS